MFRRRGEHRQVVIALLAGICAAVMLLLDVVVFPRLFASPAAGSGGCTDEPELASPLGSTEGDTLRGAREVPAASVRDDGRRRGSSARENDDRRAEAIVVFESGSSSLSDEARDELRVVLGALIQSPEKRVVLRGHADERGNALMNLRLSRERSEAAAAYLAVRGVDRERIEVVAVGELEPAVTRQGLEAWIVNRRVEVVFR